MESNQFCFSDGLGNGRTVRINDNDMDVAHAFKVVIYGYAGINIADVLIRLARVFIPKFKPAMVFLMLLNFAIMIGFFIAIHVVRFRASGEVCSKDLLIYRGTFLLIYVIAAWTFFGTSLIAIVIYVLL